MLSDDEFDKLTSENFNLHERISEFDRCITAVAAELHATCGGVDGDQSDSGSTTKVLVDAIRELKARLSATERDAKRWIKDRKRGVLRLGSPEDTRFVFNEEADATIDAAIQGERDAE